MSSTMRASIEDDLAHWEMRDKTPEQIVAETFEQIGIKKFRARNRTILVRTMHTQRTLGKREDGSPLLYLPISATSFYDGPMHLRIVKGIVLAAGPHQSTDVKVGDRVCFQRQKFSRWLELGDDQYVGWLLTEDTIGEVLED